MRGRMVTTVLVALALLAAGCGTTQAPPRAGTAALTSAATRTARSTSRVVMIFLISSISSSGTSAAMTATGAFNYARRRGELRLNGAGGEELIVPGRVYLKLPGDRLKGLPGGKTWLAVKVMGQASPLAGVLPAVAAGNPADLLTALASAASGVRDLGPATIRGVPVTHYAVTIDPAKGARRPGGGAGDRAFFQALGTSPVRVGFWVDRDGRVRQVTVPFASVPGTQAGSGGLRVTETVDFYDFGVPVRITVPPAATVVFGSSTSFVSSISSAGSGGNNGGGVLGIPPPGPGTLTPAQASAAEQTVRAFWAALGRNSVPAAARSVLPAQQGCFRRAMSRAAFTVRGLRIESSRPAGQGRATVVFAVNLRIRVDGVTSTPLSLPGLGSRAWLLVTAIGGHWYVDLRDSGPAIVFAPPCG